MCLANMNTKVSLRGPCRLLLPKHRLRRSMEIINNDAIIIGATIRWNVAGGRLRSSRSFSLFLVEQSAAFSYNQTKFTLIKLDKERCGIVR